MREKWGRFKRELFRAQFFKNSCKTRLIFMTKTNIAMRTEQSLEYFYVRYVVVYINNRTVSKVNVSLQGKVQRVTPTYPMQVSTVEHYLRVKIKCFTQFPFM